MQVDSKPRALHGSTPPRVDDTARGAPPAPATPQPPAVAPAVVEGSASEPADAGIPAGGGGVTRG
eukprot:15467747-Alexandrium_andersonii.AAC.1